ncbi:sulfite exporter TauE/SafE family protein [Oceanidesulfovibrio marinus]|uniref:Probable membrane transporter protein n=1 Tax=Oceanidesulfovibrio marinus TaxID=370038 RepID=A0A6P1ZBQ2_9BACT|nr:sulfite exporter TauE/SafE family protein [Oceanidesulfovibrio marinus]QJT09715.1 sulfite exporter TauE/SafE family protein [Oceanidesulfovibrio marinus]TVM31528.1 sulfite exporter TauE/SafE family protein [Oceanidesulfovibrio marinus]
MTLPLHLYLPIAGNSVNIAAIFGLGGGVGLLSGIFGVGGGFLMTPLLIMLGIPATVAAASDSNQIVGASTSGTLAHFRLGNVDFKMGFLLLIGGVLGGTVGVQIIKVLRAMGNADFLISITYVLMLGFVGGYMFLESLQSMRKSKTAEKEAAKPKKESKYARMFQALPWQTDFKRSGVRMSVIMPLALGTLVGILAAIMGVGGGFIMVPVMVYLLRMPMHVVVGTSLFQILFTCINVTIMQASQNHTVDFVLAFLLLIGSSIGAQVGARIGRKLQGDQLKILLATLVLVVMGKMLYELIARPDILLAYVGGH